MLKYREIFRSLPLAAFLFDDEARMLDYNLKAAEILRLVVGWNGSPLKAFTKWLEQDIRKFRASGSDHLVAEDKALPSIPPRLFRVGFSRLLENAGDVTVVMLSDVTEREKRQSEMRRMATFMDSSRMAMAGLTPDGLVLSWSQGAENLFGRTRDQALGTDMADMLPGEKRTEFREALALLRTGKRADSLETEWTGGMKKASTVSAAISPIHDRSGELTGVFLVARDRTWSQEALWKLRQSLRQYRMLFFQAIEGIMLIDPEGVLLEVNPRASRILGYRRTELLGKNFEQFFRRERNPGPPLLNESVLKGTKVRIERRIHHPEGGFRYLDICLKRIDAGLIQVFLHDMTERVLSDRKTRAARKAAERASQAKTEFLARMSHEIRTPLNAIIGMTGLALDNGLKNETREYLEAVEDSGRHLLSVINNILDFSRIETRKIEMETMDFDLLKSLRETTTPLLLQARGKGLRLDLDMKGDVPAHLRGDLPKVRQVLINLVGNAIKFTEQGGVNVKVERLEPESDQAGDKTIRIRFSVQDTGPGIAPGERDDVFKPFRQGGGGRPRQGGTGLGLAICRQLVSMMGGTITLDSEPGKGSTFSFAVDFEQGAPRPGDGMDLTGVPAGQPAPLRVLLVEDNEMNVKVVRKWLERRGHRASVAENGRLALDLARREEFDLIFMDLEMPEMGGVEVTERIRRGEAGEKAANTPIIAMTAHAFKDYRDKCMRAGMTDFITKPLDFALLQDAVARAAGISPPASGDVSGETPPAVLNLKEPEERFEGDMDMLRTSLRIFLRDSGTLLDRLEEAVGGRDAEKAALAAHSLKSMSATIGGGVCREVFTRIESAAWEGDAFRMKLEATNMRKNMDELRSAVLRELEREPLSAK